MEDPTVLGKEKKINSIQVLRGIAAFLVVMHHSIPVENLANGNLLKLIVQNGFKGVQIFFVISGFIIPYSLYKSNYHYRDFKSFMGKRLLRIEPPYIVSIILCLFLNYTNTISPWYTGPSFQIDWGNTLGHLAYLNAFTNSPWLNRAYWTLAVEFEFYILMSILFPLLNCQKKKLQSAALLILLLCGLLSRNPNHLLLNLPYFGMGICLFLYTTQKLSFSNMAIVMLLFSLEAFINFDWTYIAIGLGTIMAIQFIKKAPKPLLFLGTISYSLYLIHSVIPTRFLALTGRYIPQLNQFWAVLLCLVFILVCSYIFYVVVEKPFIVLSKRIGAQKIKEKQAR